MDARSVVLFGLLVGSRSLLEGLDFSSIKGSDLYYGQESTCFITRWSFQRMCDHIFDPRVGRFEQPTTRRKEGVRFEPLEVRVADIVFVRNIDLFMKEVHPRIKVPYIMVTHGDFLDTTAEESLSYLDDERIIAWFSIHPPKKWHPKYFPIPLGIIQKKELFAQRKRYSLFFKRLREKPKTKLLSGTFCLKENNERLSLAKSFQGKDFYTPLKTYLPFDVYMKEMASSVFTLSPRGWGPDSYRTWEALLVGTIPIVKRGQYGIMECAKKYLRFTTSGVSSFIHSQLDALYEQLPILVVDSWEDITKEFLEQKYKEIASKKYTLEPLFIRYWYNVIMAVKQDYLTNYSRSLAEAVKKDSYTKGDGE